MTGGTPQCADWFSVSSGQVVTHPKFYRKKRNARTRRALRLISLCYLYLELQFAAQ